MNKIARLAIVVLGLVFCVWVYFAPHLTVRSMRLAAERGDAEGLAAHVDFQALRDSIKTRLADAMDRRIGSDAGGRAFGALGARLATAIADPMLDTMIDTMASPQALSLLFAGRGLARDGLAAATASDSNGERAGSGIDLSQWKATMGYRDVGTFAVDLHADGDAAMPAKLIFKRHRLLWWKLSDFELPSDGPH